MCKVDSFGDDVLFGEEDTAVKSEASERVGDKGFVHLFDFIVPGVSRCDY